MPQRWIDREREVRAHKLWGAPVGDDKFPEAGHVLAIEAERVLVLEGDGLRALLGLAEPVDALTVPPATHTPVSG